MFAGSDIFRYKLLSRYDDFGIMQKSLDAWASNRGVSSRTLRYVDLMLDEIVSNIVRHAYAGREDGQIEICADFNGMEIWVTVRDFGPEFNPLCLPPPETRVPIEDRRVGGLGVHLVKNFSDRLRYRRDGNANEIIFCRAEACDGDV